MPDGDCLVWTGALKDGWGTMLVKLVSGGYGWRPAGTHVVAWTLANGPVPASLVVDHLCRNRACCRVAHLEVVTQAENARRAAKPRMEKCPQCGGTELFLQGNTLRCRPCWNAYFRQWQRDQKHPITCPECRTTFQRTAENKRFCSQPCRRENTLRRRREWARAKAHGVPWSGTS